MYRIHFRQQEQSGLTLFPMLRPGLTQADFSSGNATVVLQQLWQQGQHHYFTGTGGCRLHYSSWQPAQATAALVLIPGRIEAGHKYAEFIADALHSGYQVFVLDHRGQGASERLLADPQRGYVKDFSDYVADLQLFIEKIIPGCCSLPLLAVAHSMGGAILAAYLQQQRSNPVQAAIFSSPMWGIHTSPIPAGIAPAVANFMRWLNRLCSKQPWYVPGQGPYQHKAFKGNDLSHCAERYQWFRDLYQQYPEYQLGGVSWHWLAEALAACQKLQSGPVPAMPCLLLQGAEDTVVDNRQQLLLWQHWRLQQPLPPLPDAVTIQSARHELLTETDGVRSQWFRAVNRFLSEFLDIQAQAPQKPDQRG
ncbi:MAG TPA: hypothetical protein DF774_03780 [Rheinheimera sp.]|nr:hypothetical protein [Rheinheimera sp.]